MKSFIIFAFLFLFTFGFTQAQETSFGFKAGLNFSTFLGPFEQDEANNDLESYGNGTGFHVGGTVNLAFVDRFGLRAELLFSQKGGEYFYDGPSYKLLFDENGEEILTTGIRKMVVDITNSYIDIPVLAYTRLGRVEFSAGINVGILVGSIGAGETNYTALSNSGSELANIITTLDYNYYRDDAREAIGETTEAISIGVRDAIVPLFEGAYYEFAVKDGSFYNTFDLGLVGGLSFFLNKSLYLGGRINYGLIDITNDVYDVSKNNLQDNNSFIPLNDADKNLSIQASLGFSF